MNFKELTDEVRKLPPIWIGEYNIDYLKRFLDGWLCYEEMNKINDNEFSALFGYYFSWWLHNKMIIENCELYFKNKCALGMDYTYIIKALEKDPKEQITLFFKLLDEFNMACVSGINFEEIKDKLLHK